MFENDRIKYIVITIGIFAVVGIGLGLTGYIGMNFAQDTFIEEGSEGGFGELFVALVFFQSAIVTLFSGPIVAAISGAISGHVLRDKVDSAFVGAIGSFVGFFVMVLIALLIMTLALEGSMSGGESSGGGTGSVSDFVVPMAKAAIPTTVTGALAGVLGSLSGRK